MVLSAVQQDTLCLVVLRTMLGFSPPEFAYMARTMTGVPIDQSSARRLDKRARESLPLLVRTTQKTKQHVIALIRTGVRLVKQGKLFNLQTIERIVDSTSLSEVVSEP